MSEQKTPPVDISSPNGGQQAGEGHEADGGRGGTDDGVHVKTGPCEGADCSLPHEGGLARAGAV